MLDLLDHLELLKSLDLNLKELSLRGVPYGCTAENFPVELVSDVSAQIEQSSSWSHELGRRIRRDASGRELSKLELITDVFQHGGTLHFPENISFRFDEGRVTGFAISGSQLDIFRYIQSHEEFVREFGKADAVKTNEECGDLMGHFHYYVRSRKNVYWDEQKKKIYLINLGFKPLF